MTFTSDDVLRYWRASLADGALGEGKFRNADRKRFIEVRGEAFKTGVLSQEAVDQLFKDQGTARTVAVRFWPLVVARKTSHGSSRGGGLPDLVAPVVTEATVDRDGTMTPTRNALARDLLTPLPSGEFSIGSVDDLDAFLTETPLPEMMVSESWPDYLGHCRKMIDAVAQGWPAGELLPDPWTDFRLS